MVRKSRQRHVATIVTGRGWEHATSKKQHRRQGRQGTRGGRGVWGGGIAGGGVIGGGVESGLFWY